MARVLVCMLPLAAALPTFDEFKVQYGKNYERAAVEKTHREFYETRVARLEALNERNGAQVFGVTARRAARHHARFFGDVGSNSIRGRRTPVAAPPRLRWKPVAASNRSVLLCFGSFFRIEFDPSRSSDASRGGAAVIGRRSRRRRGFNGSRSRRRNGSNSIRRGRRR